MWTSGFYINTYILSEDRNFRTFLKENYAIALDSSVATYLLKNVKHGIEHDVHSAFEVC